jgi:hypothetical protein
MLGVGPWQHGAPLAWARPRAPKGPQAQATGPCLHSCCHAWNDFARMTFCQRALCRYGACFMCGKTKAPASGTGAGAASLRDCGAGPPLSHAHDAARPVIAHLYTVKIKRPPASRGPMARSLYVYRAVRRDAGPDSLGATAPSYLGRGRDPCLGTTRLPTGYSDRAMLMPVGTGG